MIYLDNHATTPCDPRVVDCMIPYFTTIYGNSASTHQFGQHSADSVSFASKQIAKLLNCQPDELIYTSGATESNNIAILGLSRGYFTKRGRRRKIVTIQIEHKSVLSPIAKLVKEGWNVDFLPIDQFGQVDLQKAENIINDETFLLSVQLANSEIGTIQALAILSEIAHKKGVIVHCDASQALGKVWINVEQIGVDLLSLSGHKIYGPKGIGALWVRNGFEKLIDPIMFGGGALDAARPGTQPVPLIVGLGKACEILSSEFIQENIYISELRDHFEQFLFERIPGLLVNGARENRLSNNSNLTFPNLEADILLSNLPEIIASTGAACESGSIEPSRVLLAIGSSRETAYNTVRFGFGRFNTRSETEEAANLICDAYANLSDN